MEMADGSNTHPPSDIRHPVSKNSPT